MCMQVGAIKVFIQQSALLPALIIMLLAPGCPKDNVSIDEHLLILHVHLCYVFPLFF